MTRVGIESVHDGLPKCKIYKSYNQLSTLYGHKCKFAFDLETVNVEGQRQRSQQTVFIKAYMHVKIELIIVNIFQHLT